MPLSKSLIAIAVCAASVSVAPAMAASTTVLEQSKEVQVFGYDLSDAADAEQVLDKIQSAANKVCTLRTTVDTVRERMLRRECAERAVTTAVSSLNSPTLSALWQEESQQ